MKILIKQEILMEHLNYVIKGVSTKNIIPILNCIKFDQTKNGLYLTSTDNEIVIKSFIDNNQIENIQETGSFVVSGKYIYDIVKKLPNEIINIEENIDSKLSIYTKYSSFNLNINNINDFPNVELEETKNPIIINQKIFKNIINQTSFATSNQESRPVLTGINFKIEGKVLECTTTDSYRLSKKTVIINKESEESLNIVVPTKNLIELIKLLSNEEENLEIHIFNNKIIFKFDTIIFMSRLINGTYPDTSKLIPSEFSLKIKLPLVSLYNAIDRASLLTNEFDKNTIKLETNKNKMIISSHIPEIGNVEEKLDVIKNDQEIKIAFSSKYMLEALRSFECEEVEILLNGEVKPIVIKNVNDNNLIQLIVPIRTY